MSMLSHPEHAIAVAPKAPHTTTAQAAEQTRASTATTHVATAPAPARAILSLDVFCNVIDNYGDAGVCLHLARTLSQHNYKVRLFCNNMQVLEAIAISDDKRNANLSFVSWEKPLTEYQPAAVVISAFSCHLDQVTLNTLRAAPNTLNINLEYLSAESWVESCHALPSPQDGYMSYFFFPGFTARTGGLNIDPSFVHACRRAMHTMAETTEHPDTSTPRKLSLFGYHNETVLPLLKCLQNSKRPSTITVFEGLALDNLNEHLDLKLQAGDTFTQGKVSFKVSAMVPHEDYDEILLQRDFNLVRGEDSIVRALHTGHPFLWQIYPQDENTHIIKLQSFLEQMRRINIEVQENLAKPSTTEPQATTAPHYIALSPEHLEHALEQINTLMLAYNEALAWPEYLDFDTFERESFPLFYNFAQYLCAQAPLTERLDAFIRDKLSQQ